jgi:hypothetical protein
VSNGVAGSSPILWVHDSSIVVAFGGPFFDILPSAPLLVALLLLVLQIRRRLLVEFMVHLVLFLWIKGKMWCKL